ncbi:hypothetical protein IQ268_10575 [Oculatella sp. LEGE 06141]|uniref:hypothetical protein n=1 Tax=Oculatella sp. LEGE 06141 TaxID=1828648 RepID=UPI001882EC27|nr:hypothetical protein [Oculatella sp. LEGE 06141]MBE9179004.1 hypothetical protein [Oculatella sp. LEGE 06141]
MNRYSQLTHLILDFYREDYAELQQLRPLKLAKVYRRWGMLRINCPDSQTVNALVGAFELLKEPVAQLRLAQNISFFVNGTLFMSLPVGSRKLVS